MRQTGKRAGLRRSWAVFIAVALVAPLLPGLQPQPAQARPAQAPPQPRVAEAADTARATRAAVAQKSPVRIANLTTETRVVDAQPDGSSTATLSMRPVRVKQAGKWADVDTTLVRGADGSIGPKAAAVDLAFSSGGATKPLVRLAEQGEQLAHFWPGTLPAPTLAGPVATYSEVFPGVDLRIQADVQGYVQHLVIKDAQAAKNPALARLKLRTATVGLTVRPTKEGGVEAVNKAGKLVFGAPPMAMWDSAGASESAKAPNAAKAGDKNLAEPATKARRAVAKVVVEPQALTVIPDQALLTDPKTQFPVVVDPDWGAPEAGWAKVFGGKPNTKVWRGGEDGDQVKVGKCWPSSACAGIGVVRTYFQYDTGFLAGRQVKWANLNTTVTYSPSCADRDHQLYLARWGIDSNLTWNNMPPGDPLGRSVARSVYTGCPGNKPTGFSTNGGIRPGQWSTYYLQAVDENDDFAWRKYNLYETELKVNYNTRPNPPYELNTDPRPPATPCKWCAGKRYVGTEWIQLQTRLSDPDGDALWSEWEIGGGPAAERGTRGQQGSGGFHTYDLDLRNRNGQTVSWKVWGSDGKDWGDQVTGPGPFVVDQNDPGMPEVTGQLYLSDNRWHGGVTVPGEFTFKANGTADVDHYEYGWDDQTPLQVNADALGGKATVTLTPPGDGPRTLYVRSVDRAGNESDPQRHIFYVRAGNGALTHYPFEGNTKDEAFLGDRDATLAGGASFAPGAIGSAIRLDGQHDTYVSAPAAVHTNTSFSVSAWLKPGATPTGGVVMGGVAQEGDRVSSFFLNLREDSNSWTFSLIGADVDNPPAWSASSTKPPERNKWTHLVGVYDRAASKMRLYVNGVRVTETALPASFVPFDAAGPLRIGRDKWNGMFGNAWNGLIDEVQLYDRVLDDGEIRTIVGRDDVQAGYWKFDEETGTTARNEVADSDMVVLANGATFTGKTGGAIGGGIRLDGDDDYATTNSPVIRTDQNFTVSAWVTLDKLAEGAGGRTILSQEGAKDSGFYLQQRGTSWVFGMTTADGANPFGFDVLAASAGGTAQVGTPTHITAVYDATAKRGSLYVNGKFAASDLGSGPAWHATGPLVIGRAKAANTNVDYVDGVVDEVRAYSRELSEAEISGIVARGNVTLGTWKLDGNADDANGNALAGRPEGTPDWTGGQSSVPNPTDLAVRLNGTDAAVSAPNTIAVDKTFSVTAWAKLDRLGDLPAVISQDGGQISSFKLRATPDGRWSFIMFGGDAVVTNRAEVFGTAVQVGAWTHLVASYDAVGHQLSLYVNGVLAGTKAHTQTWNHATGRLQIGRAKWDGAALEYFPGAIDDVSAYSRLLFADEIRTMAGRDLSLVHHWQLDEPSGASVVDEVGARGATISGGVTRVPGRLGNAVQLDAAAKGVVSTEHVDLRTDANFTVAAWVYLPSKDCDVEVQVRCRTDAVSIDGDKTSKFRLGHVIDDDQSMNGSWTFEMTETDTVGALPTKAAVSTKTTELNTWTHLVGVYDVATKKIWLYVDGIRIGDGTQNNRWNAGGGLQIGRGKTDGNPVEYWNGRVDDVRLYTGALDKDRISALKASYPSAETGKPATLPTPDAGYWKFDENTGTAVADASGRGNNAVIKGGTEWIGGRKGHAAWLDGTSGYAEAAGPVVDTSKSFTATAWAYLTEETGNRVVLAQDGNRVSGFYLMYEGATKRWAAVTANADQDNPTTTIVRSTEPAAASVWTHLALAYDANLKQLRLYVNGLLSGAQVGVTMRPATGPFTMGRAKWNGVNSAFFPRGIDDVRVFTKPLSAGEVQLIHDDVTSVNHGHWKFDNDTVKDTSWLNMQTTATGGPTYGAGISGRALQLDGVDDAAVSSWGMLNLRDSVSVSSWARLSRDDKTGTVAGQDGVRMSGAVLQYRAGLKRWVFGAPTKDADGAPMAYASSAQPAVLNQWTHLVGVYDHSARQLRLYVNGELAGTKKDVTLWPAAGVFTLGRGKVNGGPADFFPGAIDEVRPALGVPSAAEVAKQANWAAPHSGQLGRFLNSAGDHYTALTTALARPGYHFEGSFGRPADATHANTQLLYACKDGADLFTSKDAGCEGKTSVGEIGRVYTQQPTNLATIPLYSCTFGTERSDSRAQDCEGAGVPGVLLGYTLAYSSIIRYEDTYDHWSTAGLAPVGYGSEGFQGHLAMTAEAGTQQLMSCLDGADQFLSLDAACEGKKVLGSAGGRIWTAAPAGIPNKPLYRCLIGAERYASIEANCEGYTVDRVLGYVLNAAPTTAPTFGS